MIRRHLSRKRQENERDFTTRNVSLNLPRVQSTNIYTLSVYLSIKDPCWTNVLILFSSAMYDVRIWWWAGSIYRVCRFTGRSCSGIYHRNGKKLVLAQGIPLLCYVSKDEPSEAVGNRHLHMRLSVVCEGQTSSQCPVTSGVPQGTVLRPLLLLLYTTDFPDNLQSSVRLFAVDALLCSIVAGDADCDLLQSDLHVCRLESWQYYGQMEFNPSKCKIVTISHKKNPPQRIMFSVV